MFDSGTQQYIFSRRSREMMARRKSLELLPWPRNRFGEYATIGELLSGAVQPIEAACARCDVEGLLAGRVQ
jgi:hypothetical protein